MDKTPEVLFNKSQYLYSLHLNTLFWEGVRRFHRTLEAVHGVKNVKNPFFGTDLIFPVDMEKGQSLQSTLSHCVLHLFSYSPQYRKGSLARTCLFFWHVMQRRLVVTLPTFPDKLSVPSSSKKQSKETDWFPELTTTLHCLTSQKNEYLYA